MQSYRIEIYKELQSTKRPLVFGGAIEETIKRGHREWTEEAESVYDVMNRAEEYIKENFPHEDLLDWTIIIT